MSDQSGQGESSSPPEHDSVTLQQEDEDVRLPVGPTTLPVSTLEWGGGILAMLGFVMTPLVTGVPAGYCAWKVRKHRPVSASLIAAIIAGLSVVWTFLFFGNDIVERLPSPDTLPAELLLALAVLPLVVLVALVVAAYLLVFQE